MKRYILINSQPRSGSTFLLDLLNSYYGFTDNTIDRIRGQVWKEHFPQTLLCDIPHTLQVTLFRDPVDCLSSSFVKDFGDFIGIPNIDSEDFYSLYVCHKIDIYNNYMKNAILNKDKLFVASFDSVTSDTKNVVELIDSFVEFNPNKSFDKALENAVRHLKKSPFYNQFHNNYPIQKNKIHSDYKSYLSSKSDSLLSESYDLYNSMMKIRNI